MRIVPVTGQHGSEALMAMPGSLLGKTVGVVFRRAGSKTEYVAGDTAWTPHVEAAIAAYRPDVIVLDTGYARIAGFDGSIIMAEHGMDAARVLVPDDRQAYRF